MVHLAHAALQLARVVGAVGLPLAAIGAPLRTAVGLADEDILAVKGLEAGAVWVLVGRHPRIGLGVSATGAPRAEAFTAGVAAARQGDEPWIELDGDEGAQVGREGEDDEDKVENEEGGREPRLAPGAVQVVN